MMRPIKTLELYNRLKQEILSGRLVGGSQLPPEPEYARSLGVSRITLRNALKKLEADRLINRLERRGTFVRPSSRKNGIIVLLPCEDYVVKAGYGSAMQLQMLLNGAIQGATACGSYAETLPVSRSNSQQDISWEKFASFDSETRVIVLGCWFAPLFDLLVERGCRVVHICEQTHYSPEMRERTANWHHLHFGLEKIWAEGMRMLMKSGCRRIACVTNQPVMGISTILSAYNRLVQHEPLFLDTVKDHIYEIFRMKLLKFCHANRVDGLLLNYLNFGQDPYDHLGLPGDIRVFMEIPIGVNPPDFADWFCAPFYEAGKTAARLLCEEIQPRTVCHPVTVNPPAKTQVEKELLVI